MILACAATRTEARACAAPGVEVLRTGVGPERAVLALGRRLASGPRPSLVVSSGFAGALSADLPLHACITAAAVSRLEAGQVVPVALGRGALRVAPAAHRCVVVSASAVSRPSVSPLPPPCAIDMESAALAEVAAAAGVPFAVLRVLTDTPEAPFPGFVEALAAALAAADAPTRLVAGVHATGGALRRPADALAFVRSSLAARRALAEAWRRGACGLLETPPLARIP